MIGPNCSPMAPHQGRRPPPKLPLTPFLAPRIPHIRFRLRSPLSHCQIALLTGTEQIEAKSFLHYFCCHGSVKESCFCKTWTCAPPPLTLAQIHLQLHLTLLLLHQFPRPPSPVQAPSTSHFYLHSSLGVRLLLSVHPHLAPSPYPPSRRSSKP